MNEQLPFAKFHAISNETVHPGRTEQIGDGGTGLSDAAGDLVGNVVTIDFGDEQLFIPA